LAELKISRNTKHQTPNTKHQTPKSMSFQPFEDLRVFQAAERLADLVWDIVSEWNGFAKDTVGKQLVRAADSVGANIAEGTGRGSHQENRRFIRIARGSLHETKYWLRRAYKRQLLTEDQTKTLKTLLEELAPSLNAYLNSIGKGSTPNPKP
jgi:four helix bundle protein